jgi:hypothetical protein
MSVDSFRNYLVQMLYKTGILGIKLETFESYLWSFGNKRAVSTSEILDDTQVEIHPAFWRVLGTTRYKNK